MSKLIGYLLMAVCAGLISCGGQAKDNGIPIKVFGNATRADVAAFRQIYSTMMKAVETEDSELSLSFYSPKFKSAESSQAIRANLIQLYRDYKDPVYAVENVRLTVGQDAALTEDDFIFSAFPESPSSGLTPLEFKGHERIYWVREDGQWKISDWVF